MAPIKVFRDVFQVLRYSDLIYTRLLVEKWNDRHRHSFLSFQFNLMDNDTRMRYVPLLSADLGAKWENLNICHGPERRREKNARSFD